MNRIWKWIRDAFPAREEERLPMLSQEEIDADLLYNVQPNGTWTW